MTQVGPGSVEDFLTPYFKAAGYLTGIDWALLRAIAKQESQLDPRLPDSKTGAQGLMQLEPSTGKSVGVTNPYDLDQNIKGGASVLAQKLWQSGGNMIHALERYSGNPLTDKPDTYVANVYKYYEELNGHPPPANFLPVPPAGPAGSRPDEVPTLRPGPAAPLLHLNMDTEPSAQPNFAQNQPDPATMARMSSSDPTASQPSVRPTLAPVASASVLPRQPSAQPNFAQNQPDPLTMALLSSSAANKAGVQPTAFTSRGPVLPPQLSGLPPSPFVRAFLTNAIFGGGSPALPFAVEPGIRPSGPGGR